MLLNESGAIGAVLIGLTNNVTGDWFLTYLAIITLVITFCLAFRIPIEYSAVLILPLLLVLTSYNSQFMPLLGAVLIFSAVLLSKYWFAQR